VGSGVHQGRAGIPAAATIGGLLADPGFKDYVSRYKGSRISQGCGRSSIAPGRAVASLSRARVHQERAVPGRTGYGIRYLSLPAGTGRAVPLIQAAPISRFVVTHCANPDTKAFNPATQAQASHDPDQWSVRWKRWPGGGDRIICKISHFIVGVRGMACRRQTWRRSSITRRYVRTGSLRVGKRLANEHFAAPTARGSGHSRRSSPAARVQIGSRFARHAVRFYKLG